MPSVSELSMSYDGSLRRSATRLALAGGIEYGLQLAMPVVLVRYLDATAFGQYRFLWLLAGTALAIAPAFMPQSLFYFLPRVESGQKSLFIGNVLAYLIAAGSLVGVIVSGWNPFLPEMATSLFFQSHSLSTIFIALWVVASLLDVLPIAEEKAYWQSNSTISLALLRTLFLGGAAYISGDIAWVVSAMLVVAITKITILSYYILTTGKKLSWQMATMKKQLAYSFPFAVGNALFLMRTQADQWVVASMLSPAQYATFSIAAAFLPVATLIRQPVYSAMMPHLNSAHACGDLTEIGRLIKKTNGATALLLLPIAGGLFATAPELVEIIYTSRYQEAVPAMQVYVIGMMMTAFAVGHVLPALDKGHFAAINSTCCLALSVILNILGVSYFGLVGAAMGTVFTLAISELWSVGVVSRSLGIGMHQLLAWRALWPAVFATACALGGTSLLSSLANLQVFVLLLAKATIYLFLFVPCFLLAGGRKQLVLLTGQRHDENKSTKKRVHEILRE